LPTSLLVVVRDVFVPVFVSVTDAPATTLPCGSDTIPVTVEVPACPNTTLGKSKNAINRTEKMLSLCLVRRAFLFMDSSVGKWKLGLRPLDAASKTEVTACC
jgi:hypothetical protein